jgi:uncharacterized protein YfbU (UPF0304 family)
MKRENSSIFIIISIQQSVFKTTFKIKFKSCKHSYDLIPVHNCYNKILDIISIYESLKAPNLANF